MTPFDAETSRRIVRQLVTLLWVLTATRGPLRVTAQPFIYPVPTNDTSLFVHDKSLQTLTRHPGGLRSFFCHTCPNDTILHTSSERLLLIVSWLNEDGYAIPFPEDVTIQEREFRTRTYGPGTRQSAFVYVRLPVPQRQQLMSVTVRSAQWVRIIQIEKDARKPNVRIEIGDWFEREEFYVYVVYVTFSEDVVWDPEYLMCGAMSRINQKDVNSTALIAQSDQCSNDLTEKPLIDGVSVRGGAVIGYVNNRDYRELEIELHVPDKNRTADIVITVDEGYTDFAGNHVNGQELLIYYRPFPPPRARQRRLLRRDISFPSVKREETETTATVSGNVITTAIATTAGASIASSSAAGGVGAGSMITLVNAVQLIRMTGLLPVQRLPDNYKNFTNQFKWIILDISTPWENHHHHHEDAGHRQVEAHASGRRNLKVFEFLLESEKGESNVQYFNRMVFWVPVIFAILLMFHIIFIACILVWRKPIPDMLQPPRLELMLTFFVLPPISIAAAGLYTGNREKALVATWVIIAFPAHFIAWNFFMIWYYILRLPPHLREVNLLMDIADEKPKKTFKLQTSLFRTRRRRRHGHQRNTSGDSLLTVPIRNCTSSVPVVLELASFPETFNMHSHSRRETMHTEAVFEGEDTKTLGSDVNETEAASCKEIFRSVSNMTCLTFLFGEHQEEAEWVGTKTAGSKFNARFGVLFEDHRGPAVGRRNVTYNIDPVTRQVDRGELVILRQRPLISVPVLKVENNRVRLSRKRIYRHHLQLMAKILSISKTLLVGCIVAGVTNEKNNAACIVALIMASLVQIFLFRIAKPFPSRIDMIMLVLSEVADLIVYTCSLFLIFRNPSSDTSQHIGRALMFSMVAATTVLALDYWFFSAGFAVAHFRSFREKKTDKFFRLVHQVLMRNNNYLERKYLDRWMARVLAKGLYGRTPETHELSWKQALRVFFLHEHHNMQWLCDEVQSVCNDLRKKLKK